MSLLALAVAATFGRWEITEIRDAMTDSLEVHATVTGAGGRFVYMCGGGSGPLVSFDFSPPRLIRPGIRPVEHRVDDAPPRRSDWDYETGYMATTNATDLVAEIRAGHRLRVRGYDYDGGYIEGDFDISGADAALTEADRRCTAPTR